MSKPGPVKGSLKRHLNWWRNNCSNPYITNIICEGYKLPLRHEPVGEFLNNNLSARKEPEFVTEEIEKLLSAGVLIEHKNPPLIVNAFTVAKNAANKLRLVLDLRQINTLLDIPKYKFEDLSVASDYFKVGGYMCVFDLKSGYHHVDIHPDYHKYLGCSWQGRHYTYTVLAFGLSVAGLIFSKVVR